MSNLQFELGGLTEDQKRELLARLLRERASQALTPFALSPGQEDLWFLHELAPQSPAYSMPFCIRLKSAVDCNRLERALRAILERHSVLRCTFHSTPQGVTQCIGPMPEKCLEQVDASGWNSEELLCKVNECYRKPFDLREGPLFRATLFSSGNQQGDVLLLTVHHIIFDAWSLGILVSELGLLYDGENLERRPHMPSSYAEFVNWQRSRLDSAEGSADWEYWHSKLEKLSAPVLLPTDFPRPNAISFHGAAHTFEIDAATGARLRQLAQAENTTPFAVLATAFHGLMHRYTGAPEIPIGTPMAGRSQREFEDVIGYFVNPVVISAPLGDDMTFRQHLEDMRKGIIASQSHGDFPFVEIVRRLKPERDSSRTPIFQVVLNLIKSSQLDVAGSILHEAGREMRLGSLRFETYPLEQQEAQFDLDLTMLDTGSSIPASLIYNRDLFEPATVARISKHFLTLLSASLENPDQGISKLPLLTSEETQQIVGDWNATERAYPEATLHQLFEEQAQKTPDATALVFQEREMSYRALNERANQVADYLREVGIGAEKLVAVCMDRSFEMVVALLGVLKARGAYVPIDPSYPQARQQYMVRDAGASVILTQAKFLPALTDTDSHVFALDDNWDAISSRPRENPEHQSQPDDLAYVIYTSGTTGQPKGAMNAHRGICNRLLWMQDEYKLTAEDCILQKTPFSFDVSVWEFFWPLITGARLAIALPEGHKDPDYLASVIRDQRVTTVHFVPSMLRAFLEAEGLPNCTSLKRVICSGEALPYDLQERFFASSKAELHNLYGPTEAAVDVTYWQCERNTKRKSVPIGRPVANTQVYVLDRNMQPLPVGVPGELYLGGVQVGRGYWRRPELTAERFVPDPFRAGGRLYRTGDLVRWLPDGVIEYLGRTDHQVKIRGFRIELGEIESILSEDPRVNQTIVVARENGNGDQRLTAYLSAREGDRPSISELRTRLAGRLPDYMVPSDFVYLDEFPLSPNGKIDRRALPAPESARTGIDAERIYKSPETEIESAVVAMWEEVLQLRQIGVNDNFFELGGHSLLAAGVLSRVREHFGVNLPFRTLFEAPTVAGLASRIETVLWATQTPDGVQPDSEDREEIEI